MTKDTKSKLSFATRRYLALEKGKPNIDDFPKEEIYVLYCPSRDLTITCCRSNLFFYLKEIHA